MSSNSCSLRSALLTATSRPDLDEVRHGFVLRRSTIVRRTGHARQDVSLSLGVPRAANVLDPRTLSASFASDGIPFHTQPRGASYNVPVQSGQGTFPLEFRDAHRSGHSVSRVCRRAVDARLRKKSFDNFQTGTMTNKKSA